MVVVVDWNDFEIEKVINEDTKTKHLALKANSKQTGSNAVILLDRIPFNPADSLEKLTNGFIPIDQNDIYHRFLNPQTECKLIFPATEAHLKKYSRQSKRIIQETPEMHEKITKPHFKLLRESGQIDWIENILADQSEMERRLVDKKCKSTGFIILPDYKWIDENNLSGFYLLIIPRRNDLWSIRDLSSHQDLSLLLEMRKELIETVLPKYKYSKDGDGHRDGSPLLYEHLRVYFHYPPTYPHLHIHVTLAASTQNSCAVVGGAVLLDEVIDNLSMVSLDYYKKTRTLSMEFGEQHELYQQLISK